MPAPSYGKITLSASAQPLAANAVTVTAYLVQAAADNQAPVALGDQNVTTTTGFQLEPGKWMLYTREDQHGSGAYQLGPHDWYVCGTTGDVVSWFASP